MGAIYTQSNSGFRGKPRFEKLTNFFLSHVDTVSVWWVEVGPMWPKCAFGDQKGLIRKKVMPFDHAKMFADF